MMTVNNDYSWPPAYTVRRSLRARRTFLQIKPHQGLEIVVPYKRKTLNIQKILNDQRSWIEKMLRRWTELFKPAESAALSMPPLERPHTLECPAIAENWKIIYHPTPNTQGIRLSVIASSDSASEKHLILKGNTENLALCQQKIIRWLMQQAQNHLGGYLEELSIRTGLSYQRASIRKQTTLWGSCNSKKNISLNYKLLFFPKTLAHHVLLHELCHTKYLNHSTRFWQYLEKLDADYHANKQALKTADRYIPAWIRRGT